MIKIKDSIDRQSYTPILLKKNIIQEIGNLEKSGVLVSDQYLDQLEEVFLLRNPQYRFNKNYQGEFQKFADRHFASKEPVLAGNWFYFPWLKQVIHFLPEGMHFEMRTGRNKNLITPEEQKKFYNSTIGVMGMSVGSHAALTVIMTGGAKRIKLADPDIISGSNLNRIRVGFDAVGTGKAVIVARQIMQINPYSEIDLFTDGVQDKNIKEFIVGKHKLDLIIEEMDNPYLKVKTRFVARSAGVPIIMAADNGDGIIVDVERYDKNKKAKILHGILGNITPEDFKNIPAGELPKVIAKMAGANIADLRMIESVMQVGKSLYSWPQLGTAANLCGTVLSYLARKILAGEKIASGRFLVGLDEIFVPGFMDKNKVLKRETKRKTYLKMMGL